MLRFSLSRLLVSAERTMSVDCVWSSTRPTARRCSIQMKWWSWSTASYRLTQPRPYRCELIVRKQMEIISVNWDISRNRTAPNLLKLVNADKNHVVRLTVVESLLRRISYNWMILLVAPIGVQNGCEKVQIQSNQVQGSTSDRGKGSLTTRSASKNFGRIW